MMHKKSQKIIIAIIAAIMVVTMILGLIAPAFSGYAG